MVTIVIAAIMVTIAVPNMNDFIVKMRVDNEVSQLNRLVLSARNGAISFEQPAIICPLVNGACTANWQNELTAFIDQDNNGVYNNDGNDANLIANDKLIKIKAASTTGDSITYAGQISIRFAPTGALSPAVAGSLIYCPQSDTSLARAIVLSLSGRSYLTSDADNDGKDEFRNGGNVSDSC
ncbi:putative type IV pilus biogenesis protein [Colwellia psychrerythraea 34H]|uniref:Type II secretion system protein H n=1 Tax=Colwellia psychrerythraea (strain 34H / ATCC BAA-681) TaxID=167879 RepID=Q486Q3_COLP3|nr:putative type IV pilus biogenesis protein [Colwellia psychrerythraea 34H]